jgi:hypothetical protein
MRSRTQDGTMAVDEAARHQLYATLEATLGPESTSTLMSLLPPVGWADVATKQDLTSLENALRADMADLRTELRTGLADLRTELHTQIGGLRSELHTEIGGLRTELHTTVRNAVFSMIGAMFTLAALTWAAVSIG